MDAISSLGDDFSGSSNPVGLSAALYTNSKISEKQIYFADYYDKQTTAIKKFFAENNYTVASACFDLLLEKKCGILRRNGYTPDCGHEIDQILPVMKALTKGNLRKHQDAIEAAHGSLEQWFCNIIMHDVGEDFNMFYAEIADELKRRIKEKFERDITRAEQDLIRTTSRSVEILTHYRKFTLDEFCALTGIIASPFKIRKGQIIDLGKHKDVLWPMMNVVPGHGRNHLQIFARCKNDDDIPEIVVTRYGKTAENANFQRYGAEWTIYIHAILRRGIYETLTKLGDRAQGMATRIALVNNSEQVEPDLKKYENYLKETADLIDHMGVANMAAEHLYPGTPLKPYLRSISQMIGILHTIGCLYIVHHPSRDQDGERGFNSLNFNNLADLTFVSPIHVSQFSKANYLYRHVPRDSHLIATIMRELRESDDPSLDRELAVLYKHIKDALIEMGPEFESLLVKPLPPKTPLPEGPVSGTTNG